MNLEEARNNIGAEVELDESTKPYTCTLRTKGYYEHGYGHIEQKLQGVLTLQKIDHDGDALIECENGARENIHPRHLKLKLKPQNYKIHVPTEYESREAQGLFFELGYGWKYSGEQIINDMEYDYIFTKENIILSGFGSYSQGDKQITLQELRDMVAKKKGEDKTLQVTGTFQNFEPRKEMTWEDAFQALIDGKDVEFYNDFHGQWWDISGLRISEITGRKKFRLAPQRITLNGKFTKEELLQKIGEME